MRPTFFADQTKFRAWLERHHADTNELWVGMYKKSSGKKGITYHEAVDEALCFGWIDGLTKSVDEASYMIRFTPRTARSTWSAVNIARVKELKAAGRMHDAGLAAFARRVDERSAIYSYEQRHNAKLEPAQERKFRANKPAWRFFESQPSSYRKAALWWIVSAKKEETRERRLATLIEDSAAERRIRQLA